MAEVSTTDSSTCGVDLSVSDCRTIASFDTVLSPILLGLIVVGVLANSIMLYVIIAHRAMHTFPNLFVANLCMTHFIYLTVLAVTDVVSYLKLAMGISATNLLSSSAYLYISLVITNNTCAMLTALSIERYLKIIVDPKKSAKFQRTRVAVISCIVVWTISLIICAPVFYGNYSDSASAYSDPQYRVAVIISFVCSYVAPLIIISIIYFLIRRKLRKRGSSMKIKNIREDASSTGSTTASSTTAEDDHSHDLKILKTICFIVIIFTLNFGCLYITSIVLMILPLDKLTEEIASQVSETVAIMTASLHPIIYGMTHPTFNPYVKRLILCREECCLRCRRGCTRCCGGGRPTSLSSVMRKGGAMDGTVNANDEFVLVERFEAEQSRQRQENI